MTDRRTLKQNYADNKARAGVYAIRNLVTKHALVAGSADVQGALNRHRFELKLGGNRNAQLQREWSKHGEATFVFEVLDMVKVKEDPEFNLERELEVLTSLWRQEVLGRDESAYVAIRDQQVKQTS